MTLSTSVERVPGGAAHMVFMAINTLRYKYRLYPTLDQQSLLAQTFGCARVVYNDFVAARRNAYEAKLPTPSHRELRASMATAKKTPEREWLADVGSTALQESMKDADTAYKNFFENLAKKKTGKIPKTRKIGAPKFKSRKDNFQAIRITGLNNFSVRKVAGTTAKLRVQKIGWMRLALHRELPSDPTSVTIIREADGRYYASFVVKAWIMAMPDIEKKIGIDLGLTDLATMVNSDGTCEKIENPRFLKKKLRKLGMAQKELARRQKGSNNREKSRLKVAKVHREVREARLDHHHKLARRIVDENQVIGLETLSITGLGRTRLAKSVHDAGWGILIRLIEEKAAAVGRTVIRADRFYASTRTCNQCKHVRAKLSLRQRTWTCICGLTHDRDINAAINLLSVAGGSFPGDLKRLAEPQLDSPPLKGAARGYDAGTSVRTRRRSAGSRKPRP